MREWWCSRIRGLRHIFAFGSIWHLQVRKAIQKLIYQADEERKRLVSLADDITAMSDDLDRAGVIFPVSPARPNHSQDPPSLPGTPSGKAV